MSQKARVSHIEKLSKKNVEINEIDAFGDIPELQAPHDLMDLLNNGPTLPDVRITDNQSSDEEWNEVEVEPELPVEESSVEIEVKKAKSKEEQFQEKREKQLRLAANREKRQIIEDCHKLSFMLHMAHLRYSMLCVKNFCVKYPGFACDLDSSDSFSTIEDELLKFRDKFNHADQKSLPVETSLNTSVNRLHHIMQNLVYENDKDLTMAFAIVLLSAGFQCRLCIGFTAKPNLPANSKINVDNLAICEVSDDEEPKPKRKKLFENDLKENYWVEYFDEYENQWISVHPANREMFSMDEIEKYKPFKYALAMDNDFNIFDVTGWYQKRYLESAFRKSRLSDSWINSLLELPDFTSVPKRRQIEAHRLRTYLLSKPLPKTFKELKDHPLYVVERDLLKFEAIYPKDTQPLGQIRNENIYPRSSVYTVRNKLSWIKHGRSVIEGEVAYKVVKATPKKIIPVEERVPLSMDLFGYWQTVPYILPKVVNGRIERNEFGNIYMFLPSMLPFNCAHLRLNGIYQVARKLGLEAVPAVVGWEFIRKRNVPIIEGCVVLEKDVETLNKAWVEWKNKQNKGKAKKR